MKSIRHGTPASRTYTGTRRPAPEVSSWGQDTPLTLAEGLALLDKLEAQLSPTERELRRDAFNQMERWMIRVHEAKGIDAVVADSFPKPNKSKTGIRIDIEIWSGSAFVSGR